MNTKNIIKNLLLGKKRFQPFFQRLFHIALEGLNIGVGGRGIGNEGERCAVEFALKDEINPIIFDVGAQGGDYSIQTLSVTENSCKIYAFEPCSRDYKELKRIFFGKPVTLINKALGEKIGQVTLFYPPNISGLSSLFPDNKDSTVSEAVMMETIDHFCEVNKINRISLLKLDVEGSEFACIKGAGKMLPKIKNIQFEMSLKSRSARVYFADIFKILQEYKIYRILRDGLIEIQTPDRLSEMLFTTNYLACRK